MQADLQLTDAFLKAGVHLPDLQLNHRHAQTLLEALIAQPGDR
jgi:hypothetical protein